jgi:hypothetical protein
MLSSTSIPGCLEAGDDASAQKPRVEKSHLHELPLLRREETILHLILGNNNGINHFFRRADKLVSK